MEGFNTGDFGAGFGGEELNIGERQLEVNRLERMSSKGSLPAVDTTFIFGVGLIEALDLGIERGG